MNSITVNIPGTNASLRLVKTAGSTLVYPVNFDGSDGNQSAALLATMSMVRNGHIVVDESEKSAVVAIPSGAIQQQQPTVPDEGQGPQFVDKQTFEQVIGQLQQQLQSLQQVLGVQAQPVGPQNQGQPTQQPQQAPRAAPVPQKMGGLAS